MWFLRVLSNLHKFIGVVGQADRYFRDEKPDAVVLIDYPGLHWWIAKKAKTAGNPRVLLRPAANLGVGGLASQEGSAVRRSRPVQPAVRAGLVPRSRAFRRRSIRRPSLFDELHERVLDAAFLEAEKAKQGPIVAILPGSRTQEVTRNMPVMLEAAAKLLQDASAEHRRGSSSPACTSDIKRWSRR